jgi:hypothetical protein
MRTPLKRLLRIGLVGIVAMVFAVQAHVVLPTSAQAAERPFDERDLNGEYAGGIIGASVSDTTHTPVAGVLRIEADGAGTLMLEARTNRAGVFNPGGTQQQCSYVIEPSGFGTVDCPSGRFTILLSDGGRQFDVVFQSNNVAGGHFILQ